MKKVCSILVVILCLFGAVHPINAQGVITHESLESLKDWFPVVGGEIHVIGGGTHIINLEDDISLTETIIVDEGTTLRFLNKTQNAVTISNGSSNALRENPMFRVIGEAKLAFNYYDIEDGTPLLDANSDAGLDAKYSPIIIDCGANFTAMDKTSGKDGVWQLTQGDGGKQFGCAMIESIGAVEMYKVTVRNYDLPKGEGNANGVISLAPGKLINSIISGGEGGNLKYRYTTLKNCVIEKCRGVVGVFINVGNCENLDRTLNPADDDRYITLDGVTVRNCVTYSDNDGWGGLIRFRGKSLYCMKMKNSLFTDNFSHHDGAVLWWNAGGHDNSKCTIDGCTFSNNRSMRDAGALRLEGSFEFTGKTTLVSGNECLGKRYDESTQEYIDDAEHPGNGGGIQIYGYAGTAGVMGGNLTYKLPSCLEVKDNYAKNGGGGISLNITKEADMKKETVVNAEFNGAIVTGNKAGVSGGGIYFSNTSDPAKGYDINIYLNWGDISENESLNGGGLYVENLDIYSEVTDEDVSIRKNIATAGCGGGIYLGNGNIKLNSIVITENSAIKADGDNMYGGGGLFVKAGSFTIESGSITGNYTNLYGGGVLVYNEGILDTHPSITLTNGVIGKNEAEFGGGIAALGYLQLNVSNITLENNMAKNGGGIFAKGSGSGKGTILNYKSGIIRYNLARNKETALLQTVYDKDYNGYSGIGGGIFMGQYTHFKVEGLNSFGIYSNVAENGADDLFGYNKNVYVELPNVKTLNLEGYSDAKTHELFWVEDYITNDTNYDRGTYIKGEAWVSDKTNQRYRDIRENGVEGQYYFIDFGSDVTTKHYGIDESGNSTYLCLSLGWNVSKIKLVKRGMSDGENVIFKLYKIKDDNTETEYMTVLLSDSDKQADGSRMKEITLDSDGKWKVVETNWSWSYTPTEYHISKELHINSSDTERTFEFVNELKGDTPPHKESLKVNEMTNSIQTSVGD